MLVKACGASPRPSGRRPSCLAGSAGIAAHVKHPDTGHQGEEEEKDEAEFEMKINKKNIIHLAVS